MTVEAIKAAIEQLPEAERRRLADWLEELEEQAWDAETVRDFSPDGRGGDLLEQINRGIDVTVSHRWIKACAPGKIKIELYLSRDPGSLGSF